MKVIRETAFVKNLPSAPSTCLVAIGRTGQRIRLAVSSVHLSD